MIDGSTLAKVMGAPGAVQVISTLIPVHLSCSILLRFGLPLSFDCSAVLSGFARVLLRVQRRDGWPRFA